MDINMNVISPRNTICEVIRQIYHATDDEEIKGKCIEATKMAKRMQAKLTEYKENLDHNFFEENPAYHFLETMRVVKPIGRM